MTSLLVTPNDCVNFHLDKSYPFNRFRLKLIKICKKNFNHDLGQVCNSLLSKFFEIGPLDCNKEFNCHPVRTAQLVEGLIGMS